MRPDTDTDTDINRAPPTMSSRQDSLVPLAMEATRFHKGVVEISSETSGGSFSRSTYAFEGDAREGAA